MNKIFCAKRKGENVLPGKWKTEIRISIFARHCEEQMRHLSKKKGKIDFFELREMRSFPFCCFSVSLRRSSEQIYLSFDGFHCPAKPLNLSGVYQGAFGSRRLCLCTWLRRRSAVQGVDFRLIRRDSSLLQSIASRGRRLLP